MRNFAFDDEGRKEKYAEREWVDRIKKEKLDRRKSISRSGSDDVISSLIKEINIILEGQKNSSKKMPGWEENGLFLRKFVPGSKVKFNLLNLLKKLEKIFTKSYSQTSKNKEAENLYMLVLRGFEVFESNINNNSDVKKLSTIFDTIRQEINAFRSELMRQ